MSSQPIPTDPTADPSGSPNGDPCAESGASIPIILRTSSALKLDDDELYALCRDNEDLHIERTKDGDLVIMTPTGGESSRVNAELLISLGFWARQDGSGVVFESSVGFLLPDGAMRGPDAAWVRRERWEALAEKQRRKHVPLVPDFIAEVRSPSDSMSLLREKMESWRANGVALGWLIDPYRRTVDVYRPDEPVAQLRDPERLSGEPVLKGFVLELGEIWG